jgi:hypothetical protein
MKTLYKIQVSQNKRLEIVINNFVLANKIAKKLSRLNVRSDSRLKNAIELLPNYLKYLISYGSINVYYHEKLASSY